MSRSVVRTKSLVAGIFLLSLAAFGSSASRAIAQISRPSRAPVAALSRATFLATMEADYRKLDANGNGVATRTEVQAFQRQVLIAAGTKRARAIFTRMDTDRSGQVSFAEFTKENVVVPENVDISAAMTRLDPNKDGNITLVEYRVLTLANFDRIDIDKDSYISASEQRAAGFNK